MAPAILALLAAGISAVVVIFMSAEIKREGWTFDRFNMVSFFGTLTLATGYGVVYLAGYGTWDIMSDVASLHVLSWIIGFPIHLRKYPPYNGIFNWLNKWHN